MSTSATKPFSQHSSRSFAVKGRKSVTILTQNLSRHRLKRSKAHFFNPNEERAFRNVPSRPWSLLPDKEEAGIVGIGNAQALLIHLCRVRLFAVSKVTQRPADIQHANIVPQEENRRMPVLLCRSSDLSDQDFLDIHQLRSIEERIRLVESLLPALEDSIEKNQILPSDHELNTEDYFHQPYIRRNESAIRSISEQCNSPRITFKAIKAIRGHPPINCPIYHIFVKLAS